MDQEKVIVIDFGGQYNQLVARRVRECNVYCEIYSYRTDLALSDIKNVLIRSCRPVENLLGKTVSGGILDAWAALNYVG